MHPVHAIWQALAGLPPTISDFLRELPVDEVAPVSTRNNLTAQATIRDCHLAIVRGRRQGASPLPNGVRGWSIECSLDQYVLIGHAYPAPANNSGALAQESPVVLLDRFSRDVIYGPEVPPLAETCLGNNLVYAAIRKLQEPA